MSDNAPVYFEDGRPIHIIDRGATRRRLPGIELGFRVARRIDEERAFPVILAQVWRADAWLAREYATIRGGAK